MKHSFVFLGGWICRSIPSPINEPRWMESRLGLDRIRELLDRLGRPQDRLKFVHVAGTNGKGSTCAYLASILQAAGLRTGPFTSPYLITFEMASA